VTEHPSADPLADAIRDAIGSPFVTHYVVVVSTIEANGEPCTGHISSPGMPLWMKHGLLSYEAAGLIPQPLYAAEDEEGEGE
jgi:hypothetical protein